MNARFVMDLDEKFPHLPQAPIVEAVIHWHALPAEAFEPGKLLKQLQEHLPDYPQIQPQHEFSVEHQVGPQGAKFNQSHFWQAFQLSNADRTYLAQFIDAARQIDDQVEKVNRCLQGSFVIGTESQVRGELADVFMECMDPDWDGHNALPVTFETYQMAERFLLRLPLGVRRPSIGAEPDGHLTLEWYGGMRQSLSVSIDPSGMVHYAALVGPEREYGTKVFVDSIPQIILDLIQRVS